MLVNINRTRQLELIGGEMENDENKEYYLLVKVEPVAREHKSDETIQKVAVDNHLVYQVPKDSATRFIQEALQNE